MPVCLKQCLVITFFAFIVAEYRETQPLLEVVTIQANSYKYNAQRGYNTPRELLRGVDFINLHLFKSHYFENSIVQQLLQQSFCPLQISVGQIELHFHAYQRHWAFVINSKNLSTHLSKYASRKGILINILLDQPNKQQLLDLACRMWTERGALQIYYIIPNNSGNLSSECFFLNAFPKSGAHYGEMIRLSDKSYESIFHNLHSYPLRTYIFSSVYSNIQHFTNETSRRIIGITGADSKVADL